MKKASYKLHLKKDDIVQVISGKEKGKKGKSKTQKTVATSKKQKKVAKKTRKVKSNGKKKLTLLSLLK